jgi:aminomethyltransferase
MPVPTPFHPRTKDLCTSYGWKEWSGYYAVTQFATPFDREYFAFRHSVGMIDVSPLFKYQITGKDAGRFLATVMTKNILKLKDNQVTYTGWCDDDGKLIDDGTVMRFDENCFFVTAAVPSYKWFSQYTRGFEVELKDISDDYGIVSLQGPTSRDLINSVADGAIEEIKFFRFLKTKIDGIDCIVSRTGYTGDLGFEIWVDKNDACNLWDIMMDKGQVYRILPCGLDALDVTRVEAGFILNGVDYFSANHCLIESRKSSPYEAGLGWCVNLERETFNGQEALKKEKLNPSKWVLVGIEYDWDEIEAMFKQEGLPPEICGHAWRDAVPLYDQAGRQIGQATSGTWSPMLKKNIAICTIESDFAKPGTKIKVEMTVEYRRKKVTATVVKTPFFNPERKRL